LRHGADDLYRRTEQCNQRIRSYRRGARAMTRFDSGGKNLPHLGSDRGEFHELAVIGRVVRLNVAQIYDRRAERR
jgi:hypothetical protein